MTHVWRLLGIGAVIVLSAGCWPMPGAGPDRRSYNPFERTLTPGTVVRLVEAFRAPLADGAGPPVVTPAGLFVRTGLSIAAFEPGSGAPRWSVRLPHPDYPPELASVSDPYVVGDEVIASETLYRAGGVYDSDIAVFDPGTGVEAGPRRQSIGALQSLRGRRAAVVQRLQCCDGLDITTIDVRSIDGGSGWGGITAPLPVGGGGSIDGLLTLDDERVFVSSEDRVHAYDTTTPCPPYREGEGPLVCLSEWDREIGPTLTPVVIGDDATVYVGESTGRVPGLYALDADSGGIRFMAVVGPVARPPALAQGTLLVASTDGRLSAVPAGGCGAVTCSPAWTTAGGSPVSAQPAVAGGVVYVGSEDGTLRAFDADGCGAGICAPLWTANAGAPVTGGLAVYGGRLYVGTADALVGYALPPS